MSLLVEGDHSLVDPDIAGPGGAVVLARCWADAGEGGLIPTEAVARQLVVELVTKAVSDNAAVGLLGAPVLSRYCGVSRTAGTYAERAPVPDGAAAGGDARAPGARW